MEYKYTICFIRNNDQILMLNRDFAPTQGLWNGVGGKIKENETPLQCVVREVKEETSIDISTAEGAQKSIAILDRAINQVNDTRAGLGAANNRLEFTVNNLANVSEKTAASRSRIVDADFAAETAALSRAQVLQQAATAMLAQANARPEQVLSLLR